MPTSIGGLSQETFKRFLRVKSQLSAEQVRTVGSEDTLKGLLDHWEETRKNKNGG